MRPRRDGWLRPGVLNAIVAVTGHAAVAIICRYVHQAEQKTPANGALAKAEMHQRNGQGTGNATRLIKVLCERQLGD